MKKKLFILPLILLMSLSITGCSFVSFAENTEMPSSMVEELNREKKLYIEKLCSVSDESKFYEEELRIFRNLLKEGCLEINEATKVEDIIAIYNQYKNDILALKTIEQYEKERFEAYKQAAIVGVVISVDINDYREKEAEQVSELINNVIVNIENATTYLEVDEAVREFAIKLYEIKTDKELYEEELAEIKKSAIEVVETLVEPSLYRENEQKIIINLQKEFKEKVQLIKQKENVYTLQAEYEEKIYNVKTDAQLTHEERVAYADSVYSELLSIYLNIEKDPIKIAAKTKELQVLREDLIVTDTERECTYKYFVAKGNLYLDLAKINDSFGLHYYKGNHAEALLYYVDLAKVDPSIIDLAKQIIENEYKKVLSATNFETISTNLENAYHKLDNLEENEEILVHKFIQRITNKYGDILELPRNGLLEANDNFELGQIIDYYAFYQIDDSSLERDTFKVKLNYVLQLKDIKNTIFAYSELIQNSMDYSYSLDSDNTLTIKLIPHGFQTSYWINWKTRVNRVNIMDYSSDSVGTKRDDSFSSFEYKKYEKIVNNVWNSNQLWFALEHGYNPICVSGSSAQTCLNSAENICRSSLRDDMTIEEKVYRLFDYFAKTSKNAWFVYWDVDSLNAATKWNNLYRIAEGALNYHFGACQSFTRAFSILLGIEGIENVIRKSSATFGDDVHIDNLIKCSNDTYYLSNPHDSLGVETTGNYLSLLNTLNDNNSFKSVAKLYPNVTISTEISDVYKNLNYKGTSLYANNIDEFKNIVSVLSSNGEKNYVNIFVPTSIESQAVNYVKGLKTFNVINGTATGINSSSIRNLMIAYV